MLSGYCCVCNCVLSFILILVLDWTTVESLLLNFHRKCFFHLGRCSLQMTVNVGTSHSISIFNYCDWSFLWFWFFTSSTIQIRCQLRLHSAMFFVIRRALNGAADNSDFASRIHDCNAEIFSMDGGWRPLKGLLYGRIFFLWVFWNSLLNKTKSVTMYALNDWHNQQNNQLIS